MNFHQRKAKDTILEDAFVALREQASWGVSMVTPDVSDAGRSVEERNSPECVQTLSSS